MDGDIELPRAVQELEEGARRLATPCGDGTLVWRLWGDGDPVVMLHGGSGSWTHWVRNIPAIVGAGRQAVVPDLPGFGDSARPAGGGDADAAAAPLAEGLQLLLGDRPVDVVGFSFGSLVAALLASQQPQGIGRLVLVGAPVLPLQRGRGVELRPWRGAGTREQREEVHRHNLAAIMLHRAGSIDALALALHAANVRRDRMRRRKLVTTTAFLEAIPHLRCPYTAIYGSEDVLVRGLWREHEEALRANSLFAGMTVIPGAGHWVQFEEPDRFDDVLLAALGHRSRREP